MSGEGHHQGRWAYTCPCWWNS